MKRYFCVGIVAAVVVVVIVVVLFSNAGQGQQESYSTMSDQELMEISQDMRDQMYGFIERLKHEDVSQ